MRLVITNDDGIDSDGIHVLAAVLTEAGHEVVVVAPARDFSGAGASLGRLTIDESIGVTRVELPGLAHIEAWAIEGPPGLCVLAAHMGAFGPRPDMVVSGINAGLNTGRAVLHSGTVGAALTGQNFGLSGLAVSTATAEVWQWQAAAELAATAVETLSTYPPRSVLNLNVPALPSDQIKGTRWARLAPFGEVQTAAAQVHEERLQFTFRGTGSLADHSTDQGLVAAGYATLTALGGLSETWPEIDDSETGSVSVVDAMVPGAPFNEVHEIPDSARFRSIHHAIAPIDAPSAPIDASSA